MSFIDGIFSRYLTHKMKTRTKPILEFLQLDASRDLLFNLAKEFRTDKGFGVADLGLHDWAPHTYTEFYSRFLGARRFEISSVFECGIGTNNPELVSTMGSTGQPGASLRMWKQYFPAAHIFGADIDANILFSEERISTYEMDQTDSDSVAKVFKLINRKFDLIIDDGLHTFNAGVNFFENAFPHLKDDGLFVIEDVTEQAALSFAEYFRTSEMKVTLVRLRRGKARIGDNQLLVIQKPN